MTDRELRSVAEVAIGCPDLEAAVEFLAGHGFRVEAVIPADDPLAVSVSGHGLRLRLERRAAPEPAVIIVCRDGAGERVEHRGPGITIAVEAADPPIDLPPAVPSLAISRIADAAWIAGRAGMRYRDLVADRWGGRYIASHIHIADAGPVPDYVHFHRVDVQLIACVGGWVEVVYQDQGPPFVLEPGDAVLQPPGIRHRVLSSGDDLEVVELTAPAVHETRADHDLTLPDGERPGRRYGGQSFVHHRGADHPWSPWRRPGLEARDLELGVASGGRLDAAFVRPRGDRAGAIDWRGDSELDLAFVTAGSAMLVLSLEAGERRVALERGDAFAVPPGLGARLLEASDDLELLSISAPRRAPR